MFEEHTQKSKQLWYHDEYTSSISALEASILNNVTLLSTHFKLTGVFLTFSYFISECGRLIGFNIYAVYTLTFEAFKIPHHVRPVW